MTYDENTIVTFAERLYRRAATIITVYALLSAAVGALAVEGAAVVYRIHSSFASQLAVIVALLGAVLGGMITLGPLATIGVPESEEAARAMAHGRRGKWGAKSGSVTMVVSQDDAALLPQHSGTCKPGML